MVIVVVVLLSFFSTKTWAVSSCQSDPFAGVGLSIGNTELSTAESPEKSTFQSQGYLLEGGMGFCFGQNAGVRISGEVFQQNAINKTTSETFLEVGASNHYAAKLALTYGNVAIGGSYRRSTLETRSISTLTGEYLETKYDGSIPVYFTNFSIDNKDRFRTTVELQYISGALPGTAPAIDVSVTEIILSLRFFVLLN